MESGLRYALDRAGRKRVRVPEADLPLLYAALGLTLVGQLMWRLGRRLSRGL